MRIKELKTQLSQLNKKIILLESNKINSNNNFSSIHNNTILTKRRASSRWSKGKENDKEERLQSNNSYLTNNNNTNTNLSLKKKKIINAKYKKLEMRTYGKSNQRTLSRGNSTNLINLNTRKKKLCQGITTIDNNSKITETYNKILNNLMNFKTNNDLAKKKTLITNSHKKNSASMYDDNFEKTEEKRNIKRSLSKRIKQINNNTKTKHTIYNKLMNGIPNSKVPLTSKNNINKNLKQNLPHKYLVKNKSFLNIKRKNKEFINVE